MASLVKRGDKFSIRFMLHGERKSLATGTTAERQATRLLAHVEAIIKAAHTGCDVDQQTAVWLSNGAPVNLRKRMAAVGLISVGDDEGNVVTVKKLLDRYLASRTDVKEITRVKWRQTCDAMIRHFGADRPIEAITRGDARDFERWLKQSRKNRYGETEQAESLSAATVRKRISHAKQFFADAVARKLIADNPFAGLKSVVGANRSRDRFITRDEAAKVLDACPNNEWRLLFALSRFGGLRCPSEHLSLRWSDVDLPGGKMIVHSPKLERYEDKASRVVPIFPELRPYLEQAWDDAGDNGAEYVITGYRDASQNLRTHLQRIIRRAGLTPWEKLWANLRSSRATELAKDHPAHVAASWLGHSTLVAQKHYWQVTEGDFDKALKTATTTEPENCANFVATARRNEPQTTTATVTNTASSRSVSQVAVGALPPSGLEPETR